MRCKWSVAAPSCTTVACVGNRCSRAAAIHANDPATNLTRSVFECPAINAYLTDPSVTLVVREITCKRPSTRRRSFRATLAVKVTLPAHDAPATPEHDSAIRATRLFETLTP